MDLFWTKLHVKHENGPSMPDLCFLNSGCVWVCKIWSGAHSVKMPWLGGTKVKCPFLDMLLPNLILSSHNCNLTKTKHARTDGTLNIMCGLAHYHQPIQKCISGKSTVHILRVGNRMGEADYIGPRRTIRMWIRQFNISSAFGVGANMIARQRENPMEWLMGEATDLSLGCNFHVVVGYVQAP